MYHFDSKEDLQGFIKDQILGVSETLEILGVSYQRLSVLIDTGRITPIKSFKKDKLFFRNDVERLAEELKGLRKKYRPYEY